LAAASAFSSSSFAFLSFSSAAARAISAFKFDPLSLPGDFVFAVFVALDLDLRLASFFFFK
jgi:hypothetical protein